MGDSSQCLEKRIKEHSSQTSTAVYQHIVSNNHPKANKIIDWDSKQVAKEAREAIHTRINYPALNWIMEKMHIPEILNNLLGAGHICEAPGDNIAHMFDGICSPSSYIF